MHEEIGTMLETDKENEDYLPCKEHDYRETDRSCGYAADDARKCRGASKEPNCTSEGEI